MYLKWFLKAVPVLGFWKHVNILGCAIALSWHCHQFCGLCYMRYPADSRWKAGISTACCEEKKNSWWKDFLLWNALLGGAPGCPADDLSCLLEVSTPGKGGPESHFDPSSNSLEQTSWSLAPRPSQRGSSVFTDSCMSLPWKTNKQLNLTHSLHQPYSVHCWGLPGKTPQTLWK